MPKTGRRPQKRAEGVWGGAGNRCYGKFTAIGIPLLFINLLVTVVIIDTCCHFNSSMYVTWKIFRQKDIQKPH